MLRVVANGMQLQDAAVFQRVAQGGHRDVGDLDAALRIYPQQAFVLQPLDRLARCAQRNADQFNQLALGDELSGLEVAGQQTGLELFVGFNAVHVLEDMRFRLD